MARHLLNTSDLSTDDILSIVKQAHSYLSGPSATSTSPTQALHSFSQTPILDQRPTLDGKRIVLGFFEPSTRTRLSFETAAHRLGARTSLFQPAGSSVEKGESLQETIETIGAMGFDALVMRHPNNGVHAEVASFTRMCVINAGEGTHAHPTQGLLDTSTLIERYGSLKGLRICIVGDSLHSRVARSDVDIFQRLGAEVALCGPSSLVLKDATGITDVFDNIDQALQWSTVVNLLRIQRERRKDEEMPNLAEYRSRFALTRNKLDAHPDVCVMHPGPVNIGVEIDQDVLSSTRSLIHRQVTHGVAIRMTVLNRLLTANADYQTS